MAASANWVAVPLVGYENVVQINDGGTLRPMIYEQGDPGNYIMRSTTNIDDGAGNDADTVPPDGRVGNMKTIVLAELLGPPEVAGVCELYMLVNLPAKMPGTVPERFTTSAQWLNTANWPIVDYSKFAPHCSIRPTEYPIEANKSVATNPFLFDATQPWTGVTHQQAGLVSYYPAQWQDDAVFNPATTYANVGPYGAVLCRFYLEAGAGDGFTPDAGDLVELCVDFSHTVSN